MKIHRSIYVGMVTIIALLTSCHSNTRERVENLAPNVSQVIAEEVIQTSGYTYVLVSTEDQEYWIAVSKADVQKGETYFWSEGMEMNNFTSNELGRTFESIYFVQDFTDQPIISQGQMPSSSMAGKQPMPEKTGIDIQPAEGGITIEELYSNRKSYEGKTVKIRGKVVKFSPYIMDRNWVHLQDGTRDGDFYDLTVTTKAFINVDDEVTFEGVVALDKDFGAGYVYKVILENAEIK